MLQDLAFDQPVVDVQFELHIQSHEAALVLAVAKTMMFLDFYFFPSKNIEVVG